MRVSTLQITGNPRVSVNGHTSPMRKQKHDSPCRQKISTMQVSHIIKSRKMLILTHTLKVHCEVLQCESVKQNLAQWSALSVSLVAGMAETDDAKAVMTARTNAEVKRIVCDLCDMVSGNSEGSCSETAGFIFFFCRVDVPSNGCLSTVPASLLAGVERCGTAEHSRFQPAVDSGPKAPWLERSLCATVWVEDPLYMVTAI